MDWEKLAASDLTPALFESGDGSFWADPYISSHVLYAHLESGVDDASRPFAQILKEAQWIANLKPTPGKLLDLGCGPGLYAREFARRGWKVTGVDISPTSIDYAREESRDEKLDIDYHCADFTSWDFPPGQDLILLVYGTLGVLSPLQVSELISRCRKALAPGGLLVLDVFTKVWWEKELEKEAAAQWYVQESGGFWSPDPHLVLSRCYVYSEERAFGRFYTVVENSRIRRFPFWYRWYDETFLAQEVFAGWGLSLYGGLDGSVLVPGSDWIALVAAREGE